jgi:anti-sigma regulatory factor (Ser/Thr protein kinase)
MGLEPPLARADGGEQVVLGPDPQTAAAAARDFLRCTCLQWGFEATLDAALLVVSELVANAVVHARSQVTVRLRLCSDHLLVEVEVEDEDNRLPVLHKHTDWDALGGRG